MQKKYRVYVEQVNRTFVEVTARDEEEARAKGYAKWKREEARSYVTEVEECDERQRTALR